jgi:hypothetical protein
MITSLAIVVLGTAFAPPPGAYDSRATAAQVCAYGYTQPQRALDTYEVRDRIYNAFGLRRRHRAGYKIDHLIPLELGGVTVDANLWPQTDADAARKDLDEDRLHAEVCRFHRMTLDAARAEILRLWGAR